MSEKKSVYRIFSINPGSTSTKVAVFDNTKLVASKTDRYEKSELAYLEFVSEDGELHYILLICHKSDERI